MKDFKVPMAYMDLIDKKHIYPADANIHLNYYCPGCSGIVRKRDSILGNAHFYHLNQDKRCSLESIKHKLYKKVILQYKKFLTPTNELLVFDKVEEEKNLLDFRPDIIGYVGKTMYIIEVVNTSDIVDYKLSKIKNSNTNCFSIYAIQENYLDIISHVLDETNYKRLIYNNQIHELDELKKELQSKIDFYDKEADFYYNIKLPQIEKNESIINKEVKDIFNKYKFFYYEKQCKNGCYLFTHKYYRDIVLFYDFEEKKINLVYNK
jgi:hypothetical protein